MGRILDSISSLYSTVVKDEYAMRKLRTKPKEVRSKQYGEWELSAIEVDLVRDDGGLH